MIGSLLDVPDNMYRTITRTPMVNQSLSNLNDAAMMSMAASELIIPNTMR